MSSSIGFQWIVLLDTWIPLPKPHFCGLSKLVRFAYRWSQIFRGERLSQERVCENLCIWWWSRWLICVSFFFQGVAASGTCWCTCCPSPAPYLCCSRPWDPQISHKICWEPLGWWSDSNFPQESLPLSFPLRCEVCHRCDRWSERWCLERELLHPQKRPAAWYVISMLNDDPIWIMVHSNDCVNEDPRSFCCSSCAKHSRILGLGSVFLWRDKLRQQPIFHISVPEINNSLVLPCKSEGFKSEERDWRDQCLSDRWKCGIDHLCLDFCQLHDEGKVWGDGLG